MNELIKLAPVVIGAETVQTVNARDLHAFLKNRDHFATWIKDRIEQFDFVENRDFATYSENSEKGRGRPSIEYALSLGMAKELAMVERSDQGKQARLYFIECERRAHAPAVDPMQVLADPAAMRGLLLGYTEKVLALEQKVIDLAPKAQALDRIASSDGSFCLTDAAKALQVPPRKFTNKLLEIGWIYRRPMGSGWLAYQPFIAKGVLEHKMTTGEKSDGSEWTSTQVRVTAKGMAGLSELFSQGGSLI